MQLRYGFLFVILWAGLHLEDCIARTLNIPRASSPKIDGILEPSWFTFAAADSFTQRNPVSGAKPSLETRVYCSYSPDALYFGFLCLDSAPDSISGRIMRRDNDALSDFVDIYLDSFHDRRNCYWFTLTAAGVQSEGTIANENNYDSAWDAIWESAVARNDSGWTAEIRIPFSSIRHGGEREDGWGLNFARVIHRRQEGSFWQPVDRQRGYRVSEMGTLTGLSGIASATHLEILPHVVGRWDAPAKNLSQGEPGKWQSGNEWENLGLYVKAVPSASLTLDAAYQPDFAQVDVDQEVINLSDYPVFLQEKRPFFIEAKELFDTAPITLLYTRRIADPDYGGRVNGQFRAGRLSLLGGKNRSENETLQDAAAGRMQWNVGKRHDAGTTVTYLSERNFHAYAFEQDARLRWGQDNWIQAAFAGVDRTGLDKQPLLAYMRHRQNNGFIKWEVGSTYSGTDFNISDLGYQRYSNRFENIVWLGREYYPKGTLFESFGFDLNGLHETFTDGKYDRGFVSWGTYNKLRNGWWVGGGIDAGKGVRRKYVSDETKAAEYRDNFGGFNPRIHPSNWKWAWFDSDSRKPVELHYAMSWGTIREGKELDFTPSIVLKPRGNLESTVAFSWTRVKDVSDFNDYDPTEFRIWRMTMRWSPGLNSSFRGTVQWVHDNYYGVHDEILTNLLYAWNWQPGSWFYVVYDEAGRATQPLAYDRPGGRTVRLKWTYFFTVG